MQAAEASGQFDYDPNYVAPAAGNVEQTPLVTFGGATTTIPTVAGSSQQQQQQQQKHNQQHQQVTSAAATVINGDREAVAPPPVLKRKNSLDDFELEMEGINLDENIDTSVGFLSLIRMNCRLLKFAIYNFHKFTTGCQHRR